MLSRLRLVCFFHLVLSPFPLLVPLLLLCLLFRGSIDAENESSRV